MSKDLELRRFFTAWNLLEDDVMSSAYETLSAVEDSMELHRYKSALKVSHRQRFGSHSINQRKAMAYIPYISSHYAALVLSSFSELS